MKKSFASWKNSIKVLSISAILLLVAAMGGIQGAHAATPNPAVGVDALMVPFHISGQYTATTTAVVKFKAPFPAKLLGVQATARASGGTSPTLTVDVKDGSNSVLSSAISITAGTVAEGTISTSAIGDEDTITVDLTIGGTNPTWNDITVLLALARK